MTLTVEDGSGVAGAESYASIAEIDAYWANRPHDPLAITWAAADTDDKEGAAREASDFLDAEFGPFYKGHRAGYVQGLLFPRTKAMDEAGFPLPGRPPELLSATCQLAARAISARLSEDLDTAMPVKKTMLKVGSFAEEIEYAGTPAVGKKFGSVANLLAPILNGLQPNGPNPNADAWNWR